MPKTKRDFLKRDVAIAVTHIEEAQIRLLELKEVFAPVHPEQAQMLEAILQSLEMSISFISDFCMKTWNTLPATWDLWRNPGTHAPTGDLLQDVETLKEMLGDDVLAVEIRESDADP
jgi:hypothetical protein